MTFFGKPVIGLTYYQVELFGYAKHFKHLISELKSKPPEEYYDDPDKLIDFVEAGKNAERMGLTPSNNEIGNTNLSKIASQKEGSLSMNDMIKIHEKGHL